MTDYQNLQAIQPSDMQAMHAQLQLAEQRAQIAELKNIVEKSKAEKISRLEDSLYSPGLYEHYSKVAMQLSKSNIIPNCYKGKAEDIFVAMAMGYKLGLPVEQALQNIAVINGRPSLWGDVLMALALNHPECESIHEEPLLEKGNIIGYQCSVKRRGHELHNVTFTIKDATAAGLIQKGGVWKSYQPRMLQLRARGFALRDKFADAFLGLSIAELEEENAALEGEYSAMEAPKSARQIDKLKTILNITPGNDASNSPVPSTDEVLSDLAMPDGVSLPPVHNTGSDLEPINEGQALDILSLMDDKGFTDERKAKVYQYYNVTRVEDLTDAQARLLLLQLGKA